MDVIAPMLKNVNLSYIAQNHSSVSGDDIEIFVLWIEAEYNC